MKLYNLLPLLGAAAAAVRLYVESESPRVDGMGISSSDGPYGGTHFFASENTQVYSYLEEDHNLFDGPGNYTYIFRDHFIRLGRSEYDDKADIQFNNGYFAIDQIEDFFACKHSYFRGNQWVIIIGQDNIGDCEPVKLKPVGEDVSSAPPVTSSVTPPYSNTTVTDHVTVTDYTTWCPEETTITITTCEYDACHPTTITVDEPSTVTVTGTCLVPSPPPVSLPSPITSAIYTPSTWGDSSTVSTAISHSETGQSTIAAPSIPPEQTNGAHRKAVGLTGLAVAALFI